MGQLDPEDQDSDDDDLEIGLMGETPKHFAVQVYLSLLISVTILRETTQGEEGCPFTVVGKEWSNKVVQVIATGKQSRAVCYGQEAEKGNTRCQGQIDPIRT